MKMNLLFFLAALTAGYVCGETKKSNITATAVMSDGSCIKGALMERSFHGSTLFDPDLELPADLVHAMTFTGTNGEAKVELTNRDTFALTLANTTIDIDALIGKTTLRREVLKSLRLTHHATQPEAGLLFHCTFDSEEAIRHPEIGPEGKIINGEFEPGKRGNAFMVPRGLPGLEFAFSESPFRLKGCIEFWAKMCDRQTEFSTGGDPRFFTIYGNANQIKGIFEYASNTGNGHSGIAAHLSGFFACTHPGCRLMMPYSDIFKGMPYENWHHYAIVWNGENISSGNNSAEALPLQIFLDGKPIGTVFENSGTASFKPLLESGCRFCIPMSKDGPSYNNKSTFMIDELKVWDYDKTSFDLSE